MNDKPHKNLIAWQMPMDLVVGIYETQDVFLSKNSTGSHLRRAAVSVPSNIAEGAAGRTMQHFSNFLSNAIGSLNEIDTQLDLAHRLGYLARQDYERLHRQFDECVALTYGLRKSLASRSKGSQRQGTQKIDTSPENRIGEGPI